MSTKISQYQQTGDSVSLTKLADKPFTITAVEDSNYEKNGTVTEGVKITTKESFNIEGTECNKFHTTRTAVVSKCKLETLRNDLSAGKPIGPVKCLLVKSKTGGKDYFDLIDV